MHSVNSNSVKCVIAGLVGIVLFMAGLSTMVEGNESAETVRTFIEYPPGGAEGMEQMLLQSDAEIHHHFDEMNTYVATLPKVEYESLQMADDVSQMEIDPVRMMYGERSMNSQAITSVITTSAQITPYGVTAVQAPDMWADGYDGAGQKICIIDSGYHADHDDLPDNVTGFSQILGERFDEDYDGHGSHVAGTIVGIDNEVGVVGVAPGVELFIVKFFNRYGEATFSSDLVAAAQRCADNGANIISMSLGGASYSSFEDEAFARLYQEGILSVAAAGNGGNSQNSYPASYASVISVGAVDQNNERAGFSQFNRMVELSAPGVETLSTVPYIISHTVIISDTTYDIQPMGYATSGSASGVLVDGGLCDSVGEWTDKVVLCERGDITFAEKTTYVEEGGGVAAIIYNNRPGDFSGTLGSGITTTIPSVSMSQEDGLQIVDTQLGAETVVYSITEQPASGFDSYSGTSMATPHVAAAAALVWSYRPALVNVQVRLALQRSALDLGEPGRDDEYGYGLVQGKDTLDYIITASTTPIEGD